MEMIKPHYVSFEQAKWLKEKGFDIECSNFYRNGHIISFNQLMTHHNKGLEEFNKRIKFLGKFPPTVNTFEAPEQHLVVEWLYQKYKIWIKVDIITEYWFWSMRGNPVKKADENDIEVTQLMFGLLHSNTRFLKYKTSQEAYSAAFDYIIKNNII